MAPTSEGVWQSGDLLVIRRGAEVPDRCIKTNQPAHGKRFKATLYWHHPAINFLLISPMLYVILAIAANKKAIVYLGVTEEVLKKRKRAILSGWGTGIAGIVLFFSSFSVESESVMGVLISLSLILMLGGLIVGITKGYLIKATRIEYEYVWIRGVSKEYLAFLPEWNPEWRIDAWNK